MKKKKKISFSIVNFYNQYQQYVLVCAIILALFVIFYKTPEKPLVKVETYEECQKQPGSFSVGVDPKNHKHICDLKDGRTYYKNTPPIMPTFDRWSYVTNISLQTSTHNNFEQRLYYDFKAPYEDYYPMQVGTTSIIIHKSGYDRLDFLIYSNSSNLSLIDFISRYKTSSDNKVTIKLNSNNSQNIYINQIPGYKILFEDQTYVFLKHPNTAQIIVFSYKTDPNWYSHTDILKIFETIISTTIFVPEGNL